tara:strand:- start:982 stop:1809 length:828 start_codon:yes stop_codon:yes gene_type:complete
MTERNITYQAPNPTDMGFESNLSGYVGPYVTDMLGRGRAAASQPYTAYTGPLTAGASDLQQQAFTGIAGLSAPEEMGTYTPQSITDEGFDISGYMNPYLTSVLEPQIEDLRREAEISRLNNAQRLTGAGAFGGSRQAIMDAELDRNLLRGISDTQAKGYADAYEKAVAQFNREQDAQRLAQDFTNKYGFDVLGTQSGAGATQRGILGEGIKADYGQFIEERDYPLKTAQYMQSLLQELPLEARQQIYAPPSSTATGIATAGGVLGLLTDLGVLGP